MSIEERHRLDDIERHLRQRDPSFVALFERLLPTPDRRRSPRRWRSLLAGWTTAKTAVLVAFAATVAAAVTAVLGLVAATATTAVLALVALCVAGERGRTRPGLATAGRPLRR